MDPQKKYYNANKEKILLKQSEWKEANKEKLDKTRKEYYEKNRDILNAKKKEKVQCGCGCVVSKGNIYNHRKSKIHHNWMDLEMKNRNPE
jgi:hypothetical protein